MNMLTNSTATLKPSTSNNGTHRTGVMHQSQPPPEEPVSLLAITFDRLLTTRQVAAILNDLGRDPKEVAAEA